MIDALSMKARRAPHAMDRTWTWVFGAVATIEARFRVLRDG